MPIYEFYCPDCHRMFSFLSRRVDTEKRPACPRCRRPELRRQVSAFAISKGRKEPVANEAMSGLDEPRLEQAMESLAQEAEGLDEGDPRQGAQLMRRLFAAAGMPVAGPMEEALRRMEGGEDPEKIETEMGDLLEDPLAGGVEPAGPRGKGLAGLRRRLLPPTVDSELHEL